MHRHYHVSRANATTAGGGSFRRRTPENPNAEELRRLSRSRNYRRVREKRTARPNVSSVAGWSDAQSDFKAARLRPKRHDMIQLNRIFKFYRTEGFVKIVLDHVSSTFEPGRSYGLLGVNGAGKSTTLRLIAGTELPNSGRIRRSVRVSWPLGFAGGFHPLMTGRENVKFVARAYGADCRKTLDFVEDFSELGDYLDVPIKTYSSGMGARLAFGVSMAIDFDCYLVDEIMAVGDARFQARCREAFEQRRRNSDLIVVSHSMGTIKDYCDRGAVLVDGQMIMFESVDSAIEIYNRLNR
jgi:capsular polysaccharide transport system ATP-binding protein